MNERIIRELQMILDCLCPRELTSSGRDYIRRRIVVYEKLKEDEIRISEDTTGAEANGDR